MIQKLSPDLATVHAIHERTFKKMQRDMQARYLLEVGSWPTLRFYEGRQADYAWPESSKDDETIAKNIAFKMGEEGVFGDIESIKRSADELRTDVRCDAILLICPKQSLEDGGFYYHCPPYASSR